MSIEELLARAAAATSRQEALLLVLEAWRQQPCAQLSALALALDRDVVVQTPVDTAAFIEAAARVKMEERGGLVASAGGDPVRLAALEAWGPDPRISAHLEDLSWHSPAIPHLEGWIEATEVLRGLQQDPVLAAVTELAESSTNIPNCHPSPEDFAAYDALAGLSEEGLRSARGIAAQHFTREHQAIWANPDDDGPRLVYADELEERGEPRGAFIAEQCQTRTEEERAERHWLGRLAPVLRGNTFGFRRGFVSRATVRFRHRADVELFGDLPEWRTVEHLTWATPGAQPWCGYIGPAMELLVSAEQPSVDGLLDAACRWSRLKRLKLDMSQATRLEELHNSERLSQLESVELVEGPWDLAVGDTEWSFETLFSRLKITRWSHLELKHRWPRGYEHLIDLLEASSLKSLGLRECSVQRGADGRLSRLTVRAGSWRSETKVRDVAAALPQGFFESVEFAPNLPVDPSFRIQFAQNLRGQRARQRPMQAPVVDWALQAWTADDEWIFDASPWSKREGHRSPFAICEARTAEHLRTMEIHRPCFSSNGRWYATRDGERTAVADTKTGEAHWWLYQTGSPIGLSDDGRRLLVRTKTGSELRDVDSERVVSSFEHFSHAGEPVLHDSGQLWAIGCCSWPPDPSERVRIVGGRVELLEHSQGVFEVAFGAGGRLVGGGRDRGLGLWDLETGSLLAEQPDIHCRKIDVSGDGSVMGCAPSQNTWISFDPHTLETRTQLVFERRVAAHVLSYDGKQLAVAFELDNRKYELQVFDLTAQPKPV